MPMKRARNQARRAGPKFSYRPPDIVSVSYQSAMLRTVADAERVAVHKFSAPRGIGGDPERARGSSRWCSRRSVVGRADPIRSCRHRAAPTHYGHQGLQPGDPLFIKDSEMIRRIHRLCETVRKAFEGPG